MYSTSSSVLLRSNLCREAEPGRWIPCLFMNPQHARLFFPVRAANSSQIATGCLSWRRISIASGGNRRQVRRLGVGSTGEEEGIPHLCLHIHTNERKGREG